MAKLGTPVDLRPLAGRPVRQRVAHVGIELEGGWLKLPAGVELIRDSSIRGLQRPWPAELEMEYQTLVQAVNMSTGGSAKQRKRLQELHIQRGNGGALQIGEIPSPVLSTRESNDLYWIPWIKRFYPSDINDTCGLHVHMSFAQPFTYQRLMVPEFPATILSGINLWAEEKKFDPKHPIWPRLQGKSEYCQHTFYADEQSKQVDKDYDHHRVGNRYSVVVYRWARHQSIEIRLLPMFPTVDLAIESIQELIRITNLFLLATKKREEKISAVYQVDDNYLPDEIIAWV